MQESKLFGAVRATTIAALCAGAGFALSGCAKGETDAKTPSSGSPATEKPAVEKEGGDHMCSGDHKCSPGACGANKPK